MNKEETIRRYGKAAYKKAQERTRLWDLANPEKVTENNREGSRKGGKYYEHYLKYQRTGLRGERNRIRRKHQHRLGYIDVIQILEGEITLFTEAEIRGDIKRNG